MKQEEIVKEHPILIGGTWKRTPETLSVTSPYTDEPIGRTFLATPNDIEEALSSATTSFETMRFLPAFQRADALFRIAAGIRERQEALAKIITLESGKPIVDARIEVNRAVNTFQIAGEEAKRIGGEMIPLDLMPGSEGRWGLTRRMPIGPIVGICPFNFPLNLAAHKIAPAIASGNTLLLKPAPKTPLTALLLAEIIASTELPAGAVQIFPTTNERAEKIIGDPRIKMLNFTGSARVGWSLKEKAGKKRVLLELGGNAGVIIHSDADLDDATRRCVVGGFSYAGQVCISVQRIYVQETIYPRFLERFLPQVASLKMGNPLDETTRLCPMIDRAAAQRVEEWIAEALQAGAKLLIGGKRSGSMIEPTVLTQTTPQMKVNCEEVFAPLVTVTPYQHLDEAIAAVNRSPYGLQAGLFTRDMPAIFHAFDQIEVGGLIVNDVPTYRIDHMPYGGMKESGAGREGIQYAIREMTELKFLALNCQP